MNKLYIVLIEKSAHWHVSVWKKNFFLPFLLAEKRHCQRMEVSFFLARKNKKSHRHNARC